MAIVIDDDACMGCEACVETCPDAFEMNGDSDSKNHHREETVAKPIAWMKPSTRLPGQPSQSPKFVFVPSYGTARAGLPARVFNGPTHPGNPRREMADKDGEATGRAAGRIGRNISC